MNETGIKYGLKGYDTGFGFGIFKNNTSDYKKLNLKFSGCGLELVYPEDSIQDRSNLTRLQIDQMNNSPFTVKIFRELKPGGYQLLIFENRSRTVNASLNFSLKT